VSRSVERRSVHIRFECVQVEFKLAGDACVHVEAAELIDLPCQVALCPEPGDQILVDKDRLLLRTRRCGTLEVFRTPLTGSTMIVIIYHKQDG
jgi:hypothetical protein